MGSELLGGEGFLMGQHLGLAPCGHSPLDRPRWSMKLHPQCADQIWYGQGRSELCTVLNYHSNQEWILRR